MGVKRLVANIPFEHAGKRLDQALAAMFPDFSRSKLQQWMQDGHVRVASLQPRSSDRVKGGETVEIQIPETRDYSWEAQAIPLSIVYEDQHLLVIDKPAGLVTHPGPGNREGTLLNALLHHAPQLQSIPRAGILHRLDKDTSGLLVVAKNESTRLRLVGELRQRRIKREYLAIVNGVVIAGGDIDAPIARHPQHRTRMAVSLRGKSATSRYRVKTRFRAHTLLQIQLGSGRTHQIRVHMAHIGFPIVGDPTYGGRMRVPASTGDRLSQTLRGFRRQALHAAKLGLVHAATGKTLEWTTPLPDDMQALIDALKEDALAGTLSHKGRG
ncbi:MAG: 23S rRNA pseudouridine(1911/1915/1917) synthase RluD [Acidiferrobacterales bacterium]